MLTPIFNRAQEKFTLPADGWFHLVPIGEFPHKESGLVQVVDEKAIRAIANRFNEEATKPTFAGLLVDYDHFSYINSKSSEAAGWIKALENRADGIWGKVTWTPGGEAALKEGKFRFISPVFWPNLERAGEKRIRPLRLDSAGLTNNPNLKGMVPLSNRDAQQFGAGNDAPHQLENKPKMKSVLLALALAAEASEESALAAVNALKNRAEAAEGQLTPLKNRVSELETANNGLLELQIESDLDKYANRIKPEAKDKWKAMLLKNRAGTIELLETLAPAGASGKGTPATAGNSQGNAAAKPLHNRGSAKTPEPSGASLEDKQQAKVRAIMNRQSVGFETAWELARTEEPDLFPTFSSPEQE